MADVPYRLRQFGTSHPQGYGLAGQLILWGGLLVAGGLFVIDLAGFAIVVGVLCLVMATVFLYSARVSRGHEDEVKAYRGQQQERRNASIRKHPVLWAVGIPVAIVADAAARMARHHSPGSTGWIVGLSIALVAGVGVSGLAVRRALRKP